MVKDDFTKAPRRSVHDRLEQRTKSLCQKWATREGKRHLYEVGLLCNAIALALLFISFCSPYWIQSWPRVHSPFKRLGLWEVCFSGLVLEADPTQKAYHGCWWSLAPEFTDIRSWMFPSWFIWTQVAVTLIFCAEIIQVGILFLIWLDTGGTQMDDKPRKRENLTLLQVGLGIAVGTAITMFVTVLVFAVMFYVDRDWLPLPYFNYLSWSYGLAVLSTFFSMFGLLAQFIFVVMVRQAMREPPKSVPMGGYVPGVHKDSPF